MKRGNRVHALAAGLGLLTAGFFVLILGSLVKDGLPSITWHFLIGGVGQGGIGPELWNTVFMSGGALLVSAPLGLLTAIYLREYLHRRSLLAREMSRLEATMLSAPTIVIALIVYRIAVGWWHWPISVLTGVVALTVINWPFTTALSRLALDSVPDSYREASLALGASRFATVVRVVVPAALGVFIDGWGLSFARLAGESAAIIVTAGVNVTRHWSIFGPGATLAVHIWTLRTEGVGLDRDGAAAATGVVLLVLISAVIWVAGRLARLIGYPPLHRGGM